MNMYNKEYILKLLNNELIDLKLDYSLDESMLDTIVLDVTRAVDDKLTNEINIIKTKKNIKVSSIVKEDLRKYLLGYPLKDKILYNDFSKLSISIEDLSKAYELIKNGFNRNENLMKDSLVARIRHIILKEGQAFNEKYIQYLHKLQKNSQELIVLTINDDESSDNIAEIIENNYKNLSNYHHMILIFNKEDSKVDWKRISDVAIFMENFLIERNFSVFNKENKERRIIELEEFIKSHPQINYSDQIDTMIHSFYEGISYGFQFKDLFITNDGKSQILVMQKFELDEEPKKCPSCHEELVRGNSYPRVLYKSFECVNPSCPSRSKIGRGKRYDLLAAKRQVMLERDSNFDKIDNDTYNDMRRDIIQSSKTLIKTLISLYSWKDDSVLLINTNFDTKTYRKRKITTIECSEFDCQKRIINLSIYKLFSSIASNINFHDPGSEFKVKRINNSIVVNGNSSFVLADLERKFNIKAIQGAITSPPYYNAREYSQWQNLLLYLIDMMINAKSVLTVMDNNGVYIYNVGDVVGQDNVYIRSNMSKRRQMLGFYSIFIFELIQFKTVANYIWDKGEVESKRNSTSNLFAGYINPVNSYEHCLLFVKDKSRDIISTEVKKINVVKKINSKGENIHGHTAPYPEEIPRLLLPFIDKKTIVLDPYLGSGTTCLVMQSENIECIGFEINKEYFKLACERITNSLD